MREVFCGPCRFFVWGPMKKGATINYHAHNFGHVTNVTHGSCRVRTSYPDGTSRDEIYRAGANEYIWIDGGVEHELSAMEDGTRWQCISLNRDPDGTVVEKFNGYMKAHL